MRVLYFTKYTRKGASSRLRSYQYFPNFEEAGINVDVSPLFNDYYLKKIYAGEKPKREIITAYLKRFIFLFRAFNYDKILIEKELFPYLPAWFEGLFKLFKINFIVDYDDAIFHNYDINSNKFIRRYLGDKIDKVMRYSSYVIAGNSYLAKRANAAGAKKIEIIPTVIDLKKYESCLKKNDQNFIVGWIGSPSTFKYVRMIEDVLEELVSQYDIQIHILGSGFEKLNLDKNVKYIEWSEAKEIECISQFDVGIMPLENTPWEKGKCSYKLIQYMGCGKPVVASDVGMNKQVVENGKNGFLVNSKNEWLDKIGFYINKPHVRNEHGKRGFEIVKECYDLEISTTKLISILKS
jgi:glycosyltransferase involved in cell wall biosynthesis